MIDYRYWKRYQPTLSGHDIGNVNFAGDYIWWWRNQGFQGKMGMEPIEDEV